jgi:cobalt-precorrin 5A hydrolase
MIAIGIGASSGAKRDDFASAIGDMRRTANGGDVVATFDSAAFADSVEAAASGGGIAFRRLALGDLRGRTSECATQSKRSLELFGIASIAEAAALAAAGPGSRLIVPRRIIGRVTVAAAQSADAKASQE